MPLQTTRREFGLNSGKLVAATALGGALAVARSPAAPAPATLPVRSEPFGFCLNTSTIRGANLTLVEELDIASRAGFSAVEPWISEVHDYLKAGGTTKDLARRITDLGLTVEDAIGFDEWIVDDDDRRAKGLESMKHNMGMLAEIGAKRIAAPPIGAHAAGDPVIDLRRAAERYRAVLDLGEQAGVQPLVELWGSAKNLSRLGDVAFIVIEAQHPRASMLLDLYHLHRGGSDFGGLDLLNGAALHIVHTNDYPNHPMEKLTDADRVFPGDGVAPLPLIFKTLRNNGFRGFLSLELFNRDYWKRSPLKVAQEGIAKMRAAVASSLTA